MEELVSLGESLAQLVDQIAQIGPGLGFSGIGPKQKGQVSTRVGDVAMQGQVSQQGLQAGRIESGDRPLVIEQAETAQEVNLEHEEHLSLPRGDAIQQQRN
jgi:hypothetical protein